MASICSPCSGFTITKLHNSLLHQSATTRRTAIVELKIFARVNQPSLRIGHGRSIGIRCSDHGTIESSEIFEEPKIEDNAGGGGNGRSDDMLEEAARSMGLRRLILTRYLGDLQQDSSWPLGFLMRYCSMLRDRMLLVDPSFLFKIGTEVYMYMSGVMGRIGEGVRSLLGRIDNAVDRWRERRFEKKKRRPKEKKRRSGYSAEDERRFWRCIIYTTPMPQKMVYRIIYDIWD